MPWLTQLPVLRTLTPALARYLVVGPVGGENGTEVGIRYDLHPTFHFQPPIRGTVIPNMSVVATTDSSHIRDLAFRGRISGSAADEAINDLIQGHTARLYVADRDYGLDDYLHIRSAQFNVDLYHNLAIGAAMAPVEGFVVASTVSQAARAGSFASQQLRNGVRIASRVELNPEALTSVQSGINPRLLRLREVDAPSSAVTLEANAIRFSQSNVRNTLPEITQSMRANGWQGAPIDVVRLPNGTLVAVDNTRLAAASLTKTPIQAIIRNADDAFPAARGPQYFRSPSGDLPTTWGETVMNRMSNQNGLWQKLYPNGSPFTGVHPTTQGFTP